MSCTGNVVRYASTMGNGLLHIANTVSAILPATRFFRFKSGMYRLAGLDIGSNVKICGGARIYYPNVTIGDNTWLGIGALIVSTKLCRVTIGANCDIAPRVTVTVGSHVIGGPERRASDRADSNSISIGDGTWVGAGATFIAGSGCGYGAVIAAGSVVTKNFGPNVLVGGVPGRVIREL